MKIKMAASMLLCSVVLLCSEVSAAGLFGQLLQSADCGCEAAPAVENCGCEAAADEGCGCRQPVRGLLSKLRSGGCGCGGGCEAAAVPAPAVDCGCEAAPVADCGCEAAPSCGCKSGGLKGLLKRMAGQVPGDCGCGPTCDDPAPVVEASCGCAPEPAPVDCGCGAAPAPAPTCGCQKGGLLGRLASRSCGCGSKPLAGRFGGTFEPVSAPVADCGCAPEAAPVADCGCEAAPAAAPAPSCGCQKGGLLGRLKSRSCGCGSAAPAPVADCGCASEPTPAPVADCGCAPEPAPVADCGCEAAPAPSCGRQSGGLLGRLSAGGCGCGSGAAASDCGCEAAAAPSGGCGAAVGSSCGSASGGLQLGQRLKSGCNRCGRSSCNGGCRNSGGLTLLNKLRGDRIVRDTSNCGRCMPACPTKGSDSGCGCSSCGSATGGVVYDYAPSMEVAPAVQPMAPAVPATTEGSIAPVTVEPMGSMRKIQPVVDSAAFILRNQK